MKLTGNFISLLFGLLSLILFITGYGAWFTLLTAPVGLLILLITQILVKDKVYKSSILFRNSFYVAIFMNGLPLLILILMLIFSRKELI